jgi:hypothetical protein
MKARKVKQRKGLPPASNGGQGWLSTVLSRLFPKTETREASKENRHER